MRVAVQHLDEAHANHGVAAYHLGRAESFTHPITQEVTSTDDIMVAKLDQARAEFPESEGYRVWPEQLVEEGVEDCYFCQGLGEKNAPCPKCHTACEVEVPTGDPNVPPSVVPCDACLDPVTGTPTGVDLSAPTVQCPNCRGAKQTPKGVWKEIDEAALRARATGAAVDVGFVEAPSAHPVEVAAEQPTDDTQEKN